MIRESLSAGSAHGFALGSADARLRVPAPAGWLREQPEHGRRHGNASRLGAPDAGPDANGDITVPAAFFKALAPGTYQLTVSAIAPGAVGRSTALSFTR